MALSSQAPNLAVHNPTTRFELGKLYFERGDFKLAISHLLVVASESYEQQDYANYVQCLNMLLRMYAEMENVQGVHDIREQLLALLDKGQAEWTSRTFYTLAYCVSLKGQYQTALEYLNQALTLALAAEDRESICYATSGFAIVYCSLGRYDEALKELEKLKVFFQVLSLPDLELGAQIIYGHILRHQGKNKEALEVYWQAYGGLRAYKNLYDYIIILYSLGRTYGEIGDLAAARTYLTLAAKVVDAESLVHHASRIQQALEHVGLVDEAEFDLMLDEKTNSVIEKNLGRVDFKNQFILLDMLKMFMSDPGQVFTKEQLVERVWRQEYDPQVHDNKIYVTIKRLRKLVEPDYAKPKYIFRAKNGYYLNRDIRVHLEA